MKKYSLLVCLSLFAGTFALTGANLIPNGEFSKFDKLTGKAPFWNCGLYQQVVEEGPGVTPVLRLCAYYRSSNKMWKSNTFVPVKQIAPGTYTFSFNAKGKASMFYFFLTPGKGQKGKSFIRSFRKLQMKVLSDGWRQGQYTFTIPAEMKNARVTIEAFFAGKGEYEFIDDVSLVKTK